VAQNLDDHGTHVAGTGQKKQWTGVYGVNTDNIDLENFFGKKGHDNSAIKAVDYFTG